MEWTGELIGISQDYKTGKFNATFEINEGVPVVNFLQNLFHKKLSIEAKQFREKRSNDANAYCWALMTEIARVVQSSKDEVYEEMLQKYGCLDLEDGKPIVITIKTGIDVKRLGGHWKFYKSNGQFSSYLAIKGSSEYDSKEMSHFVDMVVSEAKELDIPTDTPSKIAELKALWGTANG